MGLFSLERTMKLKVIKGFDWAHRGVEIESFSAGAEVATEDDDLIRVATSEGWAEAMDTQGGELAPAKPSAGLKVDELKAALAAKGIDIPEGAKKDELAALLDAQGSEQQ